MVLNKVRIIFRRTKVYFIWFLGHKDVLEIFIGDCLIRKGKLAFGFVDFTKKEKSKSMQKL